MFTRALIVLLLVLNVGVAAWWLLRAPPPPAPQAASPLGVARLQLAGETVAPTTAAAVAPAPSAATAPATDALVDAAAAPPRCHRFGPYPSAAAAAAARARLQPLVERAQPFEQQSADDSGWRVLLPPQGSLVDAQAAAQSIAQAGFDDFMVVREGREANSVALGRYRAESAARERARALVAAGFAVRAEPVNPGPVTHWLDVRAGAAFDAARAEAAARAPMRDADCAALR